MPYRNQFASKGGHSDLVRNPDVMAFITECDYLKQPSEEQALRIAETFQQAPTSSTLPKYAIAIDGSPYSEPIHGLFPSTQVGYVKVSVMLIDLNHYSNLQGISNRFVDPFKVAALHRNADAFSFTLPGSNIRYRGAKSVADGFRRAIWDQLSDGRTKFSNDNSFTVRGTLLDLEDGTVEIYKCPSCNIEHHFCFTEGNEVIKCSNCNEDVFLTDTLRIHEQISDFGDCTSAITRFMNASEQLLLATFIRMLFHHNPQILSQMAFIIDGPLAVFGQPAKISFQLVRFYNKISTELSKKGIQSPIVFGLQKDGAVMEHARSIETYIQDNSFRLIDDEYRNLHIAPVNNDNFGSETYFGQDFIFKLKSGRIFNFAIPYPFTNKSGTLDFRKKKAHIPYYGDSIARTLDVIRHFELDLFENAIVPVALAHRHASISVIPGGKVLELITKHGLNA